MSPTNSQAIETLLFLVRYVFNVVRAELQRRRNRRILAQLQRGLNRIIAKRIRSGRPWHN